MERMTERKIEFTDAELYAEGYDKLTVDIVVGVIEKAGLKAVRMATPIQDIGGVEYRIKSCRYGTISNIRDVVAYLAKEGIIKTIGVYEAYRWPFDKLTVVRWAWVPE